MRRVFAAVMACCLFFITGCNWNMPEQGVFSRMETVSPVPTKTVTLQTTLGYAPSEVISPDWLDQVWAWDTYGDVIWLGVETDEEGFLAASYNTTGGQWQRYPIDTPNAHNPTPKSFSVTKDSLWVLFQESNTASDIRNGKYLDNLGYYIFYINFTDNSSSFTRIPFEGGDGTESSRDEISSVQAITSDIAILSTHKMAFVVDSESNVLDKPTLPLDGLIVHRRINDQLYIYLWSENGFAPFDSENFCFGDVLIETEASSFSSNAGNYYCTENQTFYGCNISTGEKTEVFKWMDVALSYESMGGGSIFENSEGQFFYPTNEGIVKIAKEMIPDKHTLVLACFGDTRDALYDFRPSTYFCSEELLDAIIRFNNTDPEFRIQIKPMVYSNDSELERLLIELATSSDIDVIDTSLLPENALKAGLLVDMLPYIDADVEIDREDFIEPLLKAMERNGGLYEYTNKFSLLTITTHPQLFDGRESWTINEIQKLKANYPELKYWSRERLFESFIKAATAEFIDWEKMSCSFDSAAFKNWLVFLKELPNSSEVNDNPPLFSNSTDFAADVGYWTRIILKNNYVVAGFPETNGTGSYFVKLDHPLSTVRTSIGSSTRLGIMASGKHHDGAWRFVRTLMLGKDNARIDLGIPAFKENFEKAVSSAITDQYDYQRDIAMFTETDAQILREQVYNTSKLVRSDESLLNIIRNGANMYFEGQYNLDEAVRQIQSRVNIYLAEQG